MGIKIQVPKWSALVMLEGGLQRFSFGACSGYIYSQMQFNLVGSPYDEVFDP